MSLDNVTPVSYAVRGPVVLEWYNLSQDGKIVFQPTAVSDLLLCIGCDGACLAFQTGKI